MLEKIQGFTVSFPLCKLCGFLEDPIISSKTNPCSGNNKNSLKIVYLATSFLDVYFAIR